MRQARQYELSQDEALDAGLKFLGEDYKEIGNGVFRGNQSDGQGFFRQFRIDDGSLLGNHNPFEPHVHLELYQETKGKAFVNNHIILSD